VFGARDVWQNNNFGLSRDGVALLVVLWAQIILPKRERQETHQHADDDQNDMFGVDKPLPRAEDTSIGIAYKALLADFGDKLGKKTRLDMNLGILAKLGFIERRGDIIVEGPLLDLMMDTDQLKERIINGALADVFKRSPAQIIPVPRSSPPIAAKTRLPTTARTTAPRRRPKVSRTPKPTPFRHSRCRSTRCRPRSPSADSTELPAKD
jgi:hypothetical protein